MSISLTDANINLLIATMSAISAFLSIVLVSWPYLMPDTLGARMKQVKDEREAIRRRERSKLLGNEAPSLRTEPKKIFKDILDRLNLWEEINNTTMVKKLRMAGYRGQSPIVTFVAAQVIIPGVIFIVTALFAFVIPQAGGISILRQAQRRHGGDPDRLLSAGAVRQKHSQQTAEGGSAILAGCLGPSVDLRRIRYGARKRAGESG